jgi:hypothetical protein
MTEDLKRREVEDRKGETGPSDIKCPMKINTVGNTEAGLGRTLALSLSSWPGSLEGSDE